MRHVIRLSFLASLLFLLQGCGNFMSINWRWYPDGGDALSIDAKQRVVYSITKKDWTVVCAEPSPDALTAISTSSSLSAQQQVAVAAALGISESAASIGLRTQTIQLLRDAMYRLCEGYASVLLMI